MRGGGGRWNRAPAHCAHPGWRAVTFVAPPKTKRGMRRVRCAQQEYTPFDIPLESSARAGYFAVDFGGPPFRGGVLTCPNALTEPCAKQPPLGSLERTCRHSDILRLFKSKDGAICCIGVGVGGCGVGAGSPGNIIRSTSNCVGALGLFNS